MERRDFLGKTARLGILAGLAAGTAHLFLNKQVDLTCKTGGLCGTCSVLKDCGLEEALKFRNNGQKNG